MQPAESRLYPHVLHRDPLRKWWVCGCGRVLTSEWLARTLGGAR